MCRTFVFLIAISVLVPPACANARIEIILMAQANGLRPPSFDNEIRFRGTPFGHMALYVESATLDEEKLIRQCDEGERGGLVLTVDRQLKDEFFAANPRDEFFYGRLRPDSLPRSMTRSDIKKALQEFDEEYRGVYQKGPGISGFGQNYGILYIRDAWGLVYPTTRDEEARIIEYWQRHRHDEFYRICNNCVTTVIRSLCYAGLERRSFFIRGLAPYNAWAYFVKRFIVSGLQGKAPDGNFLRRDGAYVTRYEQIYSEAVMPSGRPFNVYSLLNLEYLLWVSPGGARRLPSDETISYVDYPTGREEASDGGGPGVLEERSRWFVSQFCEFTRLWFQSFDGLWWLVTK